MSDPLLNPLALPSGAVLSNRLAKAAMSEGLADACNHSTSRLETLYRRWADSGVGLLLSGNIQVDRRHLELPANVVVDDDGGRSELAGLARAGTSKGAHFWAQLSHTGRQVDGRMNPAPLAPSSVGIDVIRGAGYQFALPRAMNESEIAHAIDQFIFAAREVRAAGFTGLSLHAAHGYLFSQFLSPLTNRRTDRWGGSLRNRSRFLLDVIAGMRETVGRDFPIGIKLNASDFQKGGFTNSECIEVVKMLNDTGLDLLELSGGSLEQPKLMGITLKEEGEDGPKASTAAREAFFIAFAGAVRAVARMPVMVTGGFRTRRAMVEALETGELDVIGIGRPMIIDPESPRKLLRGEVDRLPSPETHLDRLHLLPWNNMQLSRLGAGLDPDPELSGEAAQAWFVEAWSQALAALHSNRCRA